MRVSFIALFVSVALAAPSNFFEVTRDVDWEAALTGRSSSEGALEARAGSPQSMDKILKGLGKLYFGTCGDGNDFTGTNSQVILEDFGQLTPENSGKWDTIEPQQGKFNFAGLDTLVNYAQTNHLLVRGHNTLWYSQLPSWVSAINNKATLTSVIQNHVSTEIGRYAGKILQWDVVNEIFDENGGLRVSVFSTVLGEDFVSIAFNAAKSADPNAKRYINDYNTVEKGVNYAKTKAQISYVKKWIAAGVPIDGIGAQTHLQAGEASNVPAALAAVCAAAPECAITELDIVNAAPADYVTVVQACVNIANCVGITVWGVRDPDSWRASSTPLLFNAQWAPKPAYSALVATIGALKPSATSAAATTAKSSSVVATATSGPSSVAASPTPTAVTGGTVPLYGQCGGLSWTGATGCVSGSTCVAGNAYYSQCVPS